MTKRKSTKQAPSNPTSPTNKTTPAVLPSPLSTHINVDRPGLSEEGSKNEHTQHPSPIRPPPPPPTSFLDPNFIKIHSIADELRPFLTTEWDIKVKKKITKPQIYCILLHFNPLTQSRPSNLKEALISAFEKDVKPLIQPHYNSFRYSAGEAMDTKEDAKLDSDFDPLSSKTTSQMLRDEIEKKEPGFEVPKATRRDGLLRLYKAYLYHDLVIPIDS